MLTPLTPDQFRAAFPEFADASISSDDTVSLWLTAATSMVNEARWGSLSTIGMCLWAAHNLVLSGRDQNTAAVGGVPGEMNGAVSSKAVDRVSVGYDTASATLNNAGDYALTTYGIRYLKLARMLGSGGVQL